MWSVPITAIGALTLLESVALLSHTDGAFFLPVVAAIGAIAGYSVCDLRVRGGKSARLSIRKE